MFNNLIESSSHTKEYKRRGSFLLFTGACYVVLFVVLGVVSIYAYDARLEQQILEDVVLLSPQDVVTPEPVQAARPDRPRDTSDNNTSNVTERAVAMLSVNHPEVVPTEISATPSKNPPLPDGPGIVAITGRNRDAGSIAGPGGPSTGPQFAPPKQVVVLPDEPPPAPVPQPPKILKVSRVLNSQALSLPPPVYPPIARQTRTQGTVIVQVLIDEDGKVISAKATSGHPFLVPEAQKAAFRARFSPTVLGDQKVKVQGVITYNFVLGN
jgi:periplasmic protein TonB